MVIFFYELIVCELHFQEMVKYAHFKGFFCLNKKSKIYSILQWYKTKRRILYIMYFLQLLSKQTDQSEIQDKHVGSDEGKTAT